MKRTTKHLIRVIAAIVIFTAPLSQIFLMHALKDSWFVLESPLAFWAFQVLFSSFQIGVGATIWLEAKKQ